MLGCGELLILEPLGLCWVVLQPCRFHGSAWLLPMMERPLWLLHTVIPPYQNQAKYTFLTTMEIHFIRQACPLAITLAWPFPIAERRWLCQHTKALFGKVTTVVKHSCLMVVLCQILHLLLLVRRQALRAAPRAHMQPLVLPAAVFVLSAPSQRWARRCAPLAAPALLRPAKAPQAAVRPSATSARQAMKAIPVSLPPVRP